MMVYGTEKQQNVGFEIMTILINLSQVPVFCVWESEWGEGNKKCGKVLSSR